MAHIILTRTVRSTIMCSVFNAVVRYLRAWWEEHIAVFRQIIASLNCLGRIFFFFLLPTSWHASTHTKKTPRVSNPIKLLVILGGTALGGKKRGEGETALWTCRRRRRRRRRGRISSHQFDQGWRKTVIPGDEKRRDRWMIEQLQRQTSESAPRILNMCVYCLGNSQTGRQGRWFLFMPCSCACALF